MKTNFNFLGETLIYEIKISDEHDAFRWCSFVEASKLIKLKNTREVLDKANEFLTGRLNKYF